MIRRSLATLVGLPVLALAALGGPISAQATDGAASPAPEYQQTKHLERTAVVGGVPIEVDSRDVTVTVDRTTELRGRERVTISWTGAQPTGGRAMSPFGELGLMQEYPVVILQCRGIDDPSLPPEQQLSPETCWTSSRMQRTQTVDESEAVWRHDVHATDAQRAQKSGLDPIPAECGDVAAFSTHITPFRAANGTVYAACTAETMPPEAAIGAAFPPAEMAAFTDLNGEGSVKFEVRTSIENESLGCSDTVACSIVVIPIEGISCLDGDPACNRGGQWPAGSSNYSALGVDAAVSPALWWAPSNWRNRFSVPLTFGLPPDACSVLDDRPPTGFYGSELMSQAALQWSPAYCLNKKRFKFQHNRMADVAGFALAENGGGAAAFVSSKQQTDGSDPIAYAPTAVTAFSIAYVIDKPDNAGEFTDLKLSPRLIAKLLTQSYLGSELGRGHPGMETNPIGLNLDPEFQQLNPGLDTISREPAATLLSLSESSDVIETLTSYVANDKEAMDFVSGKPDPWGMKVNPSYKKIKLPRDEWPLLDDYIPPTTDECKLQNPTPYFTQLAAPVTSLRKIAEAVLDSWPNVQTRCERSGADQPWKIGRVVPQGVGSRFMLGLVASGDAKRLGLNEAKLLTKGGVAVGPDDASLTRALRTAEPSKNGTDPFTLDMAKVVRAGGYPGTMIVYTAARTANLPAEDAAKVSMFIDIATTEGQKPGFGNGQLPSGFLPITKTGPTKELLAQAKIVAKAIGDQSGKVKGDGTEGTGEGTEEPTKGTDDAATPPASVTEPSTTLPEPDPVDSEPAKTKSPKGEKKDSDEVSTVAMPDTEAITSSTATRLIPLLLGVLWLAAIVASVLRAYLLRRRTAA